MEVREIEIEMFELNYIVQVKVYINENMFLIIKKTWLNPPCKYLGVTLKESKRIFDFHKFWG